MANSKKEDSLRMIIYKKKKWWRELKLFKIRWLQLINNTNKFKICSRINFLMGNLKILHKLMKMLLVEI